MVAASPDNQTLHRYKRTNRAYIEDLGNGVKLTMLLIPGGEFMMGAPEGEPESRDNERPQHRVKVPPFLIGRYPVTQAEWRVVAGYDREDIDLGPGPSRYKGDNLPVEKVSWHDVIEFCKRLAAKTHKNYHLPSEAQWEYACRAEITTAYHFGDQLTDVVANYESNVGQTTAVGTYPANRWGLHDMHGNVYEWCLDYWHGNYDDAPTDNTAWIEGGDSDRRVRRGGSWNDTPRYCRSAYRDLIEPGITFSDTGLRVCCSDPRTFQPPTD